MRIGLANEVVPHGELIPYATSVAKMIADHNAELIGIVKGTLDAGALTSLSEAIRLEQQALVDRKAKGGMQWQK